MSGRFPIVDLDALARAEGGEGVDLNRALEQLLTLYVEVDRRNAACTAALDLPCKQGCDACCHESVFLTPLEFFCVWEWVQAELDEEARDQVCERGIGLYEQHRETIERLDTPPPDGERDHFSIAQGLRFRCPLLGEAGECLVYPARELYARLFGCSFNSQGGIYGCDEVGQHLAGKEVTLLKARTVAQELDLFELTGRRQVYPHYIYHLYRGLEL